MSRSNSNPPSRNSAHRSAAPVRKSRGGMLLGVFLGLLLGVVCAFGVVWYINKTPLPFADKTARPEKSETSPAAAAPAVVPPSLPGKPGDKAIEGGREKPRFEFYKILPGSQEATPGAAGMAEQKPGAEPPNAESAASAVVERYYLQAGAFQKAADADNLKAKFALMGLETSVQEVNLPDKGVMHRVRVGPFGKLEEMNRVRTQLSQNGIQATVVKVKENNAAAQ